MAATRVSWNCVPFEAGDRLPLAATFSQAEYTRICEGLVPQAMEDKWFIYCEPPHLFFHRSWTGQPVYRVKLVQSGSSYQIEEAAWATELARGKEDQLTYQSELLAFLISNLLLGKSTPFPRPTGLQEGMPGVFQHHVAGTHFHEVNAAEGSQASPFQPSQSSSPSKKGKPWWRFWR
jgi:hypothetical protein